MNARVMIGIPTSEFARRADFYDYVDMIEKEGEGIELVGITRSHGQSPARNRNVIIETALQNGFTHILFLDDDVVVRPDIIKKLLAHDKDIVTGLYLMRNHPHFPILFDESYQNNYCRFQILHKGRRGLVEAVNTGLGACMFKIEVFEKMSDDKPWIRLGQIAQEKDHWCDDIEFFNRCREKYGYKLWCDLECPVGHMVSGTVFPMRKDDGTWVTAATFDQKNIFELPQNTPSEDEVVKGVEDIRQKLSLGDTKEKVFSGAD